MGFEEGKNAKIPKRIRVTYLTGRVIVGESRGGVAVDAFECEVQTFLSSLSSPSSAPFLEATLCRMDIQSSSAELPLARPISTAVAAAGAREKPRG